eukprot:c31162_g1_i1 orf=3-239(-)
MAKTMWPTCYQLEVFKEEAITPKVECKDAGNQYVLIANLHGFEPGQVEVQVERQRGLVVRGHSRTSSFRHSLELPADAC